VDGEAEERMELKVASLVISVSPLMVAAVWKLADANVAQGACKGSPVVQQILLASNMVLPGSGMGRRNSAEGRLSPA
jgi:hypothetical protein